MRLLTSFALLFSLFSFHALAQNTYTNKDFGVSITFPGDQFGERELPAPIGSEKGAITEIALEDNENFAMYVLGTYAYTVDKTEKEAFKLYKEELFRFGGEASVDKIITKYGRNVNELIYSLPLSPDVDIHAHTYVVFKDNRIYSINVLAQDPSTFTTQPALNFFNSFKIGK